MLQPAIGDSPQAALSRSYLPESLEID